MNVTVQQGAIQESTADTIIVNLFDDVTTPHGGTGAVDQALDGAISELIANGDLSGQEGEVGVFYPRGMIPAKRVLIVGLGKREGFDLEGVRKAAAYAIKRAKELNGQNVATIVHGAGVAGLDPYAAAQAVTEASALALYEYDAEAHDNFEGRLTSIYGPLFDEESEAKQQITLTLVEFDESKIADMEAGARVGGIVAQGVSLARDLVNLPPNIATPSKMADTAVEIAKKFGLTAEIGDRAWAEMHKMGAFLAVAKGAGDEPKFVILEHNAKRDDVETIVLVGKGITFDTGGISLKPSANMGLMKSDMGGAAAVLGAMYVVGALDLPLRVIGLAPCTENKPDADAYRPSDVITASNGKTIEIISTDAEGRMALADALVYAQKYEPDLVIDLATLTGSAIVALGSDVAAALFATSDGVSEQLLAAGAETFERVWRLPLFDDYRQTIKSDVADIKNSGGRTGGVGTSAVFLQEFIDYTWAHLDIAGMAYSDKGRPYSPKGATGYGVRLLTRFLQMRG